MLSIICQFGSRDELLLGAEGLMRDGQQHLDAVLISTQLALAVTALNMTRIFRDEERVLECYEMACAAHQTAGQYLASFAKEDLESLRKELNDLEERLSACRFSPLASLEPDV